MPHRQPRATGTSSAPRAITDRRRSVSRSTPAMQLHYERSLNGLRICKIEVGRAENNIYIVSDVESGEAYILDAGYEPDVIAKAARGLRVRSILVTHGHRDHHEHVGSL